MRFRIATLLYVIAYLAVSIAAFGAWGIAAAGLSLGLWLAVRLAPNKDAAHSALFLMVVLAGMVGLLLPAVGGSSWSPHLACKMQLRELVFATRNFVESQGRWPEAVTYSPSGQPLQSWRTQLLPCLGEQPLFDMIEPDKPWNGPANRTATNIPILPYCCQVHSHATIETHYYAVVDDRTVWSGKVTSLDDIADGASNTLVLIEADLGAQWAEPRDLTFDEAVDLLTGATDWYAGHGHQIDIGYFYRPICVLHLAFADGEVRRLEHPVSANIAAAMLTCNGGEAVDCEQLNLIEPAIRQFDYSRIAVFTAFCLLSLAPARWAFSRRADA